MARFRIGLVFAVITAIFSLPTQGLPLSAARPGLDGAFAQLAQQITGFGGYFFDAQGDLNVYLTDLAQEPAARAALAEVARNRPEARIHRWSRPAAIVVRRGNYDFPQLDGWRGQLREAFAIPGVQSLDTDEAANRVHIGVTTQDAVDQVQALADRFGVPPGALVIEVVPPISLVTNLTNFVRPTEGGLQIDWTGPSCIINGVNYCYCTLGANVWYSNPGVGVPVGTAGFFTASHCSNASGSNDGASYSQGGSGIGTEMWDPPFFDNSQYSGCPLNRHCRWSDATFVAYGAGVSWQLGAIARTLSHGTGLYQPGSIDIDPNNPRFSLNSVITSPTVGTYLDKVGRTTGWTEGPVSHTCTDYAQTGDHVLLCQDQVDAFADGGDSGSPMFQWSYTGSSASFAGIVWAKISGGLIFSNTQRLQNDFGVSITFF
jgi:hypothetical protein